MFINSSMPYKTYKEVLRDTQFVDICTGYMNGQRKKHVFVLGEGDAVFQMSFISAMNWQDIFDIYGIC